MADYEMNGHSTLDLVKKWEAIVGVRLSIMVPGIREELL